MTNILKHPATVGGLILVMVLIWGVWLFGGRRSTAADIETVRFTGTLTLDDQPATTGEVILEPVNPTLSTPHKTTVDANGFQFPAVAIGEYFLQYEASTNATSYVDYVPVENDDTLSGYDVRTIVTLEKDTVNCSLNLRTAN